MDRINHPTAPSGQFTEGDPGQGIPGTVVTADHMNAVQEELIATIEAAGLTPDAADLGQIEQAIGILGGTAGGLNNRVLNGGFEIWQRGESFSADLSGAYTADRWRVTGDGPAGAGRGTVTHEQAASQAGVVEGTWDFLRYTPTVPADQGGPTIVHRAEVLEATADRQMTLSFMMRSAIATTVVAEIRQVWGATVTIVASQSFSLSSSWQRLEMTVAMPDVAGVSFGIGPRYVEIEFRLPNLVSAVTELGRVQFEAGTSVTDFEERAEALELYLCRRYFQKSYPRDVAPGTSFEGTFGVAAESQDPEGFQAVRWVPEMRTAPAVTLYTTQGVAGQIIWDGAAHIVVGIFFMTSVALGKVLVAGSPPVNLSNAHFHYTADAEL